MKLERGRGLLLCGVAVGAVVGLAACSGGGGGGPAPSPSPRVDSLAPPPQASPAPPAAPAPAPVAAPADPVRNRVLPPRRTTPEAQETREYRNQRGLTATGASEAYARGITGKGVTVVVADGKVDAAASEMQGRIAPGGFDLASDPRPGTDFDHGTFVASVIAARRDGVGFHGVAPDARILPVAIFNPDGKVNMQGGYQAGLVRINQAAIAAGARVVNNSWGAESDGTVRVHSAFGALVPSYRAAISQGIVTVWAAGNDGKAQPSPQSLVPLSWPELEPGWLVAVALDPDTGLKADFSNACGAARNWCLAAPGRRITGQTVEGYRLGSGTSFAAPMISGALALLFEAWPTLTADQARQILFLTADDLGSPGVDEVYGRGGLNIARAFSPVGSPVMAGTQVEVATLTVTAPPALGGALEEGLAGTLLPIEDSFARGFSLDAAALVQPQARDRIHRLARDIRGIAGHGWEVGRPLYHATGRHGLTAAPLGLGTQAPLGRGTATLGWADGGRGTAAVAGLEGAVGPLPFAGDSGPFLSLLGEGPVVNWQARLGQGISYAVSGTAGGDSQPGWALAGTLSWQGEAAALSMSVGSVAERAGYLGLVTSPLGGGRGETSFTSLSARFELTEGVTLGADAHLGWTAWTGPAGAALTRADTLSSSFGLALAVEDVAGGRLTLSGRQPLRAEAGSLELRLPGLAAPLAVDAVPAARQLDLTVGWSRSFTHDGGTSSDLGLAVTHRANADHRRGAEETVIGARWRRSF